MAAEEMEDGGEESKERSSSSPPPPTTPNSKKNPNDLPIPGLSNCHSCGLSSPPKIQSEEKLQLQSLDSQWRLVLLCDHCLDRIRSAEACSYCFSNISAADDGRILGCRECSRRIHLRCAPLQRGYVALSELCPDSFTCIDCSPILGPHRRKTPRTVDSLENLARDAKAAAEKKGAAASRAKEKALQKAASAGRASKRVRSLLGADATGKHPPLNPERATPDEELALQLHLAMNGSQRISRNPRGTTKVCCSGNFIATKTESVRYDHCNKVGFSTEDKVFFDSVDESWLNQISSVESESTEKKYQKKELDGRSGSSLVEGHVKPEQESCDETFSIKLESNEMIDQEKGIDWCGESNLVEIPVEENQGSCNRSSSIVDSNEKRDHDEGINGDSISSLVEVIVKEEQESCHENSSIEMDSDERKDQKNEIDGYRESYLVETLVNEENGNCDQRSSLIELSCNTKKDQKQVTDGYIDSHLVEVHLKEQQMRYSHNSSTELDSSGMEYQKGMNEYSDINLVDIPVKEEQGGSNGICPISVSCQDQQRRYNQNCSTDLNSNGMEYQMGMNEYSNINLVDIPVREEQGGCSNGIGPISVSCQVPQRRYNQNSSTELNSNGMEYQMGMNEYSDINLVDIPVKEEQGGCSNGIGPISVSCQEKQWRYNQNSSTELDSNGMECQKRMNGYSDINLVDIPVKEEQGGCSNSIGPISASCQRIHWNCKR